MSVPRIDAWIGGDVLLMRGIAIGDGAVIAGGATVTRDVAPYTIAGGNPARVIRPRFTDPALADGLARSRWWRARASDLARLSLTEPARFLDATAQTPIIYWSPPRIDLAALPGQG